VEDLIAAKLRVGFKNSGIDCRIGEITSNVPLNVFHRKSGREQKQGYGNMSNCESVSTFVSQGSQGYQAGNEENVSGLSNKSSLREIRDRMVGLKRIERQVYP
jgi:hypothetical protein